MDKLAQPTSSGYASIIELARQQRINLGPKNHRVADSNLVEKGNLVCY